MAFPVDGRVFVKHPKKSWIPGFVTARDAKTGLYTVTDDEHDEVTKVPESDVTLCREDLLNEGIDPLVHDLLFLTVLHDSTLLRCLKVRYMKDIIYTNIGAIVVALNPFNFKIPHYQDSMMDKYLAEEDVIRHNLPHSWAVAHNTYFELRNDRKPQTILVSGESGAGKTEACKMVMKYLGRVSMKLATEDQITNAEEVREKIQQSSPILEGFGNAKTVRNNNSSRFGKFVKVKFAPEGYLAGAFTINYLLEKSRIVTAATNERVYHALYQVCKGKWAAKFGLKGAGEYRSTNAGKCLSIEGEDDSADFDANIAAMTVCGINADEQDSVWRTVAGVLVAQNIELKPIDMDTTSIAESSAASMKKACELWGVKEDELRREFLTTTSTVRGETFVMNLKLAQATDMRDALCKHMYEKLFHWLIAKLNDNTDCPGDHYDWIGVLDIFGFEDFESGNSFEPVCINLANETLQNHYNNYIFKRDLEECRSEGICVDEMKCPDNTECLQLITDSSGILGLLDEECRLQTGTDDGYLEKVIQNCTKNPFFARKPTSRGTFMVKHYAGTVTYQVKGFLEKNRDSLKDDIKVILRNSSDPLVASLLPPPAERSGRQQTVGGFFKLQVAELMYLINSTNPHWIRCVKPHPAKKPLMFDGVQVTNQLESSGVLGTVKIRKAGYPVRMTYPNFLARYKILIGKCPADSPMEQLQAGVRKAMKASKTTPREVQLGKTRVFMKSEAYFELEKARDEAGVNHRLMIQSHARSIQSQILARRKIWTHKCELIQEEFRDYLRRSEEVRIARRKAKEALMAKQKEERIQFDGEALAFLKSVEEDYDVERRKILEQMAAHAAWIDEKAIQDAEERTNFYQLETKKRYDIINDLKHYLNSQIPNKMALHLQATPAVEEIKRLRIIREESREYDLFLKAFREHGAAMFRAEVERAERRFRRLLLRIEDLQFLEMMQRLSVFPEFIASLTRAVHPYGKTMLSIKHYAETVAKRAMRRNAHLDAQQEIEDFTTRHPRDHTKLDRELASIQVGSIHKRDTTYVRMGDKKQEVSKYCTSEAWQGVRGVPDIDQVLKGMNHQRKNAKQTKAAPRPAAVSTDPNDVVIAKDAELKMAGVFETFSDRHQEMQFIRRRHILSLEFKALSKEGRYAGPFTNETEIPDRKTFFIAQDQLQLLSSAFSEELVKEIQVLNAFCVKRGIPEQNPVTGQWLPFMPVPAELVATYPPCNDWKRLIKERERLTYTTENYKMELLKIIRGCVHRGAKFSVDVDENSSVEQVHTLYHNIRGHFSICKRCLYPMATKGTLIQLRLLWPHVQDPTFSDRCKDCNTSVFSKKDGPGSLSLKR